MKLVIGGAFQGKSTYAKETFPVKGVWIDGEDCAYEEIFSCGGVLHFHRLVQRFLGQRDLDEIPRRLGQENPEIVIVSNELGCGVVPVDKFDRAFREKTGRLCTKLAAASDEVHRVVCGIGVVIKRA